MRSGDALPAKALSDVQACGLVGSPLARVGGKAIEAIEGTSTADMAIACAACLESPQTYRAKFELSLRTGRKALKQPRYRQREASLPSGNLRW